MDNHFAPDIVRSPEEVVRRTLALFSIVGLALGAPRSEVIGWLDETGIRADLAPSEESYIEAIAPSRQQIVDATWHSERLAVLCWALYELTDLPRPDEQCDTASFQGILPPFADVDTASFIARARLRPDGELVTKADEILGHHWEARNAKLTGTAPRMPVNIEIIQERHHAINWVIGYDGSPWDEITTDT